MLTSRSLSLFLLINSLLLLILLIFTIKTNFNGIGYTYELNEETRVLTIEEGFLKKKTYDVETGGADSGQVIHAMLLINDADRLWKINIYIIPLFIAGLIGLFSSSFKQNRHFKRYITVYVLCFTVFVYWSINAYQGLFEDLQRLQDFITNLKS